MLLNFVVLLFCRYEKLGYITCGSAPFPDPSRLRPGFEHVSMQIMRKKL